MGRSPCCDKTKVKRGPWSPEEDNTLKNYVEKHGTGGSWIALPHKAGLKRCGKSCRLRWLNYLRPNIKHGGFTEEEDSVILRLYHNIGSRWSVIASQLPGRTDNDVKNYWNTKLKKKLFPATPYTGAASSTAGNFTISSTKNPNLGLETRRSKFDNMLPYFPMEVNSHHQELLAAEIPLPGLMEVTENYVKNAYNCGLLPSASLSEEAVPSLSPSISLDNNANGSSASWSAHGTGAEDDTFLANLGSDQLMPYDLLMNTFDFQEKFTDQIDHLNFGYSLLANISNTEQQQQPIFQSLTY